MNILDNEHVIFFDVDDTIVMWSNTYNKPGKGKIKFKDPYLSNHMYLTPNKKHITLLKTHKARGYLVIVWSAAGYKWADEVISALNLEKYVDVVMSKPTKYVDDLEANQILGTRVYLK